MTLLFNHELVYVDIIFVAQNMCERYQEKLSSDLVNEYNPSGIERD